jgi:septal ring factor EnvC (AmiA/AmiB activator)
MASLEQNLAQVMVQIRQIERLLRGPTEEERQQMQEQLKDLEAERERIMQQLMTSHNDIPKLRKRDRERERERERERRKTHPREAIADTSKQTDT